MTTDVHTEGFETTPFHMQETDILLKAENTALEAAKRFIHIQFKKPIEEFTHEELVSIINKQTEFSHSEILETLAAVDVDPLEELDGYADVFYTYPALEYMINHFNISGVEEDVASTLHLRKLQHTRSLAQFVLQQSQFKADTILKAVERVCENNLLKFTTDKEFFDSWVSTEGFDRNSTEIDGEVFYFLSDAQGKVRKRDNFPKVDLTDLLDGDTDTEV